MVPAGVFLCPLEVSLVTLPERSSITLRPRATPLPGVQVMRNHPHAARLVKQEMRWPEV